MLVGCRVEIYDDFIYLVDAMRLNHDGMENQELDFDNLINVCCVRSYLGCRRVKYFQR